MLSDMSAWGSRTSANKKRLGDPASPDRPVHLTEAAADKLHAVMKSNGINEAAVRIGVDAFDGNEVGYLYQLGFANDQDVAQDMQYFDRGIRLAIRQDSLSFLKGTVVEYHHGFSETGFKFKNPNSPYSP